MGATAAPAPARSETIGRELATAEVVDGRGGDAVLGRCVGTTGGGSRVVGGGGVRVFTDGVGQVEGVEIKTRRRGRGTWHLGEVSHIGEVREIGHIQAMVETP